MSDHGVDPETVRHVARLARIDLTDAEVDRFSDQFAEILDAFETLDEVPRIEGEPSTDTVVRGDEPRECLDREDALRNAEETEAGYFKGPKVS